MADKKISALTSLAQGDVAASTDVLPIVDTSATETKKITASALVGAGMTAGVTNVDINSGSIDNTAIGASTASTGAFTTLSASSTVSGTGFSTYLASPPAIGGTTAAAGSFTTLTTSSTLTVSGGTANGVLYLNGSKVATSGTALSYDGTVLTLTATDLPRVKFTGSTGGGDGWIDTFGTTLRLVNNTGSGATSILGNGQINISTAGGSPIVFTTSGSEQMRLNSTGLGIGTSSPATLLDVRDGVGSILTLGNTGTFTAGESSYLKFREANTALADIGWEANTNEVRINNRIAGPMTFYTSNTEKMRLDSSGNLGLGVTPSAWLSSQKALEVSGWSVNAASLTSSLATNAYVNASSQWIYKATGFATRYDNVTGQHQWYNAASGTAGGTISFTQAMTLDASGNLGVGVTSLEGRFEVRGGNLPSTHSFLLGYGANGDNYYTSGASGIQVFRTGSTERARITSGGDFCVNTTAKVYEGLISVSFDGNGGSGDQGIALIDTNASLNGDYLLFVNSAGNVAGKITHNGTTTVAYTTSSDYRLKNTIAPITGALAKVALLKPCTYKWNVDGSDGQGFIAHELAEVVPDCVVGEKDAVDAEGKPRYQGVDTSFLVATLTAAIQELTARVAQLESK